MSILLELKQKITRACSIIDDKIQFSVSSDNCLNASLETIKELRNLSDFCLAYNFYKNNPSITSPYCYNTFSEQIEPYAKQSMDKVIREIYELHTIVNETTAHDLPSNCGADMVILRYKDRVRTIISFIKSEMDIDVLKNFNLIFNNISKDVSDYYDKISKVIEESNLEEKRKKNTKYKTNHYYLEKTKPFPSTKSYYELTFSPASDDEDKSQRFIVYSDIKLPDYYPVRLQCERKTISLIDGAKIDVLILIDYSIVLKEQDLNNLSYILHIRRSGNNVSYANLDDYKRITAYMKSYQLSLYDMIVKLSDDEWKNLLAGIMVHPLFDIIMGAKAYIDNDLPGCHTLSLLLHRPRVKCLKKCILRMTFNFPNNENEYASDLAISYQALPFEQMPVASALPDYPVSISDKRHIIKDFYQRKDELFSLYLNICSSDKGRIYIKKNEIETPFDLEKENINGLINSFNSRIYHKHIPIRSIKTFHFDSKYVFVQNMEDNCLKCLRKIKIIENKAYPNYQDRINDYVASHSGDYSCLSSQQKEVVDNGFSSRGVLCISGPAGTGKTTLLKNIRSILSDRNFQFLSQTNASVNNLRRKIGYLRTEGISTRYSTIESFLRENNTSINNVCVVIDESSTVSNKDMADVLDRINSANCLLIICGDDQQIEAIEFGNWFTLSKRFLKADSVFYLTRPFRTNNETLQKLWTMVRKQDSKLKVYLPRIGIVENVSIERISEIFKQDSSVVLCLNYDGLYGVNNLNNILQQRNQKTPYEINDCVYKEGDPIIFDSSIRLEKFIYNNQKGKIKSIKKIGDYYEFVITLFDINDTLQKDSYVDAPREFKIVKINESTAELTINFYGFKKVVQKDNKDCFLDDVPFTTAYAITIHKAQGLEFDNVAVVISDETAERITKNIFYTAITRSKDNLRIFCNSITMNNIIDCIVTQRKNMQDKELIERAYPEFVDNRKEES